MTDALWPHAAVNQDHYTKDWTRHPIYIMDKQGTHPLYPRNATRPPYNSDGIHPICDRKPLPQRGSGPSALYLAIARERGYPDHLGALPYDQHTTPAQHRSRERRPAPRAIGRCRVTYPQALQSPAPQPFRSPTVPPYAAGVDARRTRTSESHARPEQQQTIAAQHVEPPGRPSPSRPVSDAAPPPPPPTARSVPRPAPNAAVTRHGEYLMSGHALDTLARKASTTGKLQAMSEPGPAPVPPQEPETVSLLNPTGKFAEKVAAVRRLREFDESIPHDHLPSRRPNWRKRRRFLPRLVMLVRCRECEQPWPCHPLRANLHRTYGDNITAKIKELSTKKNRTQANRRSPTAVRHRAWSTRTWYGKPKPE